MSDRNQYRQAIQEATPERFKPKPQPKKKRDAPSAQLPIRQDPERQARKYGRPTTFRLPDDFRDMLKRVEAKHRVTPPDLIQLAVSQYVQALESGKVELPLDENSGTHNLILPDVPEVKV